MSDRRTGARARGRAAAPRLAAPRPLVRAALRHAVLDWYDARSRPLPWRARPSLYGAWIAEMMLQQTTVTVAAPYWERFLARFPDVRRLAAASEEEVLALWSGLGYYRRARDLHAAARQVVARDGGRLPGSRDGWLALPGVGRYTAGAIASIALGEPVPAVDANARRVLLRLLCASPGVAAGLSGRALEALAAALVDPDRPGDWNQALMDLAAELCRPARPDCAACPVKRWCRARRAQATHVVPPPAPRRTAEPVRLALLVLERRGAVLLLPPGSPPAASWAGGGPPARDAFDDLYGGLWGLPSTPWYPAAPPGGASISALREAAGTAPDDWALAVWREWLGSDGGGGAAALRACGSFGHVITRFRLTVHVVRALWSGGARDVPRGDGARWWDVRLDAAPPLSGLARRALRLAAPEA